ncbi:ribonuclease HII [Nitrospira sp. Nam74]
MEPTDFFEIEARRCGYQLIGGLDEAGRGPLAGPVVAAIVILPRRFALPGLNDSKQVREVVRERLYQAIIKQAIATGVGMATEREIETLNILQATRQAMCRAVGALTVTPDFLLLDAVSLPSLGVPQRPIIKGDAFSVSIAAASILAKVTRDRLMREYHRRFPRYNFASHKGYGTPEHRRLLSRYGPCSAHRQNFRPVAEAEEDGWEMFG